jgi:hypothetical protein
LTRALSGQRTHAVTHHLRIGLEPALIGLTFGLHIYLATYVAVVLAGTADARGVIPLGPIGILFQGTALVLYIPSLIAIVLCATLSLRLYRVWPLPVLAVYGIGALVVFNVVAALLYIALVAGLTGLWYWRLGGAPAR